MSPTRLLAQPPTTASKSRDTAPPQSSRWRVLLSPGLLHVGDIIKEINGQEVTDPDQLQEVMRQCSGSVTLKVLPSARDPKGSSQVGHPSSPPPSLPSPDAIAVPVRPGLGSRVQLFGIRCRCKNVLSFLLISSHGIVVILCDTDFPLRLIFHSNTDLHFWLIFHSKTALPQGPFLTPCSTAGLPQGPFFV